MVFWLKKKPDLLSTRILDPETRDTETTKAKWPKESEKVEREKVASVGAAKVRRPRCSGVVENGNRMIRKQVHVHTISLGNQFKKQLR